MPLRLRWSGNVSSRLYARGKDFTTIEVKKWYKKWKYSIWKNGKIIKQGTAQSKAMAQLRAERAYFGK